jgi:hypothetical protein
VNSCISSNLPSFTTRLDLGATAGDGSLLGNPANVVWSTTNVLPGMNIAVSPTGTDIGVNEGLVRAYNLQSFLSGGEWTDGSYYPARVFPGHFDSQPVNGGYPYAVPTGDPGDILVGLRLNGAVGNKAMLLSFGAAGFDNIGFRVSSRVDTDFTLRVQVFANADGSGALLYDTLTDLSYNGFYSGVGGTCASLTPAPLSDPVPCNDAPFLGLLNFEGAAHSIVVSTSDTNGFYIGQVFAGADSETPEPGTFLLGSCGLAALIGAQRRYRRKA